MKGTYVLLVRLGKPKSLAVGKLGKLRLKAGYYAYVGSAMNGLDARIRRHLGHSGRKKLFWHIDYLLADPDADVSGVFRIESGRRLECAVAKGLAGSFEGMSGFGCSDCGCASHLFFSESMRKIERAVKDSVSAES